MMNRLDDVFVSHACDILAKTSGGLSGAKIVEYCNSYAVDFNRKITHYRYPFDVSNKRTVLLENLRCFEDVEQFKIIKDLCELPFFEDEEEVKKLKTALYRRFGSLAKETFSETELIQTTKHWLSNYPKALELYESALVKFEGGFWERNTLDDIRLSFELLVKDLLGNDKSLENQIPGIGGILDKIGTSVELKNMVQKIVDYYTKFQNNHVKHDDAVNGNEIEYVIEFTSAIMKFLIKANGGN